MKKLIAELKKPLNKKDIMPVIKSGIFMSFVGGLLIGAFHLLFTFSFDFSLTWLFLLILAHLTAKRIKRSYEDYHILYQFMSIFFFLFSFYLMSVTMYMGLFFLYGYSDLSLYLPLLNPIRYFSFLSPFQPYFFELSNLFDIFFLTIGLIYAYIYSK
jgi:hypothetical protein